MANEKNFKLGAAIAIRYQAPNAVTGLAPVAEIFDETGAKDLVNFPDVVLTEIGATGRYVGSYVPDADGEWLIQINDGTGKGKVIIAHSCGSWNIHEIGQAMAKDSTVAKDATVAKAADLANLDGDVVAVKAVVDSIQSDIDSLEVSSPPMVV